MNDPEVPILVAHVSPGCRCPWSRADVLTVGRQDYRVLLPWCRAADDRTVAIVIQNAIQLRTGYRVIGEARAWELLLKHVGSSALADSVLAAVPDVLRGGPHQRDACYLERDVLRAALPHRRRCAVCARAVPWPEDHRFSLTLDGSGEAGMRPSTLTMLVHPGRCREVLDSIRQDHFDRWRALQAERIARRKEAQTCRDTLKILRRFLRDGDPAALRRLTPECATPRT